MSWFILLVAGIFEIVWAVGLKYTQGFSVLLPSIITIAAMIVSFLLLAIAIKKIPVGTAYACWTGFGAVGIALIGMFYYNEPATAVRLFFLACIICGVLGLKFFSPSTPTHQTENKS